MGWGRNFLLGSFGMQMDIQEVREEIQRLRQVEHAADSNLEKRIDRIEMEVRELSISFVTVVNLLVAKGVVREELIRKIINEIDPGEETGPDFDGRIDFGALARESAAARQDDD